MGIRRVLWGLRRFALVYGRSVSGSIASKESTGHAGTSGFSADP